jgi:phosphatidate cytidylyltransferase
MKRILTATVLILAVLAILFLGPPWLLAIAGAIVASLSVLEYRGLAREGAAAAGQSLEIPIWWLITSTLVMFVAVAPIPGVETVPEYQLPVLSLLAFLLLTFNGLRQPFERVLPATAQGVFALLYIVCPLATTALIRAHADGLGLLTFLFVCVWSGDIAALYLGKRFGRNKLAPTLSPNKTVEGSLASVGGSVVFGMAIYYLGRLLYDHGFAALSIAVPAWQMLLLAIVLNIAAQLGDLLESALKRGAGVKDSGTMLPGHGGLLDRIDALLLAAPVMWYALLLKDWFNLFR